MRCRSGDTRVFDGARSERGRGEARFVACDAAVLDMDDTIGERDDARIVRHDEDRPGGVFGDLRQDRHDGVPAFAVERARRFVLEMEKAFPRMNLTLASMRDLRHLNHDLVFNASPMGASGEPLPRELKRVLPGTKVVFDAVYRPRETRLLVEAERVGAVAIHGEEMLLHQGMAAFRLWTGKEAPEKVMRKALAGSPERGVKKTGRRRAQK